MVQLTPYCVSLLVHFEFLFTSYSVFSKTSFILKALKSSISILKQEHFFFLKRKSFKTTFWSFFYVIRNRKAKKKMLCLVFFGGGKGYAFFFYLSLPLKEKNQQTRARVVV